MFDMSAMRYQSMAPYRPCESSGSEHSPEEMSLSDLVNSFLEKDIDGRGFGSCHDEDENGGDEQSCFGSVCETKDELLKLVSAENDATKRKMFAKVEDEIRAMEDGSNRALMRRLRARGLDAGLCKSKWQKSGSVPAGDHEYIDINTANNTRYIIEISLAQHFTIARPTYHYASLLDALPEIFVGTTEELKQVVKLMCKAIKDSMKSQDMTVPPWRKNGFMKVKWLGSYKRTTKAAAPTKMADDSRYCQVIQSGNCFTGFQIPAQNVTGFGLVSTTCRDEFCRKNRMKQGLLATAFSTQQSQIFTKLL